MNWRLIIMNVWPAATIVVVGLGLGVLLNWLIPRWRADRQFWAEVETEAEVYQMRRLGSLVSVRLTADEHAQLRKIAERDEVGYTVLVRDWIRERLTREAVAALPSGPPQPWESATWTCPHLNASGPLVSLRCATCGPLPAPTTVTYRVAS